MRKAIVIIFLFSILQIYLFANDQELAIGPQYNYQTETLSFDWGGDEINTKFHSLGANL